MDATQAQAWVMIIVALGAAIAGIVAQWRTGNKITEQTQHIEKQAAVIETVEKNTNSRVSKQDDMIQQLQEEVRKLVAEINSLKHEQVIERLVEKLPDDDSRIIVPPTL